MLLLLLLPKLPLLLRFRIIAGFENKVIFRAIVINLADIDIGLRWQALVDTISSEYLDLLLRVVISPQLQMVMLMVLCVVKMVLVTCIHLVICVVARLKFNFNKRRICSQAQRGVTRVLLQLDVMWGTLRHTDMNHPFVVIIVISKTTEQLKVFLGIGSLVCCHTLGLPLW
jgi:hypothetical protein